MLDEQRLCTLICFGITLISFVNLWNTKSSHAIVMASLLVLLYAHMLYLEGYLVDAQVIHTTTFSFYLFLFNIILWFCTIIKAIRNKRHKKLTTS